MVVSQCFSACFGGGTQTDLGEQRLKLVLIGLDNAGKTTLLNTLRNVDAETTPTYGFISQTIRDAGGVDIEIYDLGGGKSIRRIWCEQRETERYGPPSGRVSSSPILRSLQSHAIIADIK